MSKFTNVCWCFFFTLAHRLLLLREHMWGISVPINIWGGLALTRGNAGEALFLPTRRSACRNKHYFSLYVTLNVTLEAVSLAFTKTVLTLRPASSVGPLNCWVLTAQQFMIILQKLKGRIYRGLALQLNFRMLSDISKEFLEKLKRLIHIGCSYKCEWLGFIYDCFLWLLDTQRMYYLLLSLLIFVFFFIDVSNLTD